jgi:hypothetical protein
VSGSGGIAPSFLTPAHDEGEWSTLTSLTPGKKFSVRTGLEAGWASELVWTLWSRERSLVPAGSCRSNSSNNGSGSIGGGSLDAFKPSIFVSAHILYSHASHRQFSSTVFSLLAESNKFCVISLLEIKLLKVHSTLLLKLH